MKAIALLPLLLAAAVAQAQVVINEVDYDQVGTDTEEYVEILNTGTSFFPLQYLNVVMYSGSSGSPVEYRNISSPSWPALGPGEFFVVCANATATLNCDHVATPATNLIQNGPTDAIALIMSVPAPNVIDVLSYGGTLAGATEGNGATAEDSNDVPGISIGRFPDGQDTNDNDSDFHLMCSSPGVANLIDPLECDLSTGLPRPVAPASFILLPASDGRHVLVFDANAGGEPISFELLDVNGRLLETRAASSAPRASWSIDAEARQGQLLIVRLLTPTRAEARRFVLP